MISRGLLVAVGLSLIVGACDRAPQKHSELGRFVIVHSQHNEADTILLDTVTGQTWSRVQVTDITDQPVAWSPMPQLNSATDLAHLAAQHPPPPPNLTSP